MNSTHKTSCIYDGALVRNSQIGAHCIIGSDSFIADSKLYRNVTIERRNMILNSIIDQYSGTGPNTTIRFAEVGKYCSISWNVSIGGAEHPINKLTTHAFPFVKEFGICENDGGGIILIDSNLQLKTMFGLQQVHRYSEESKYPMVRLLVQER